MQQQGAAQGQVGGAPASLGAFAVGDFSQGMQAAREMGAVLGNQIDVFTAALIGRMVPR